MRVSFVLALLCTITIAVTQTTQPTQAPKLGKGFPPTWHTWSVSTVKNGNDIISNYGQLINYYPTYSCRYNQQDLKDPDTKRPGDYCDYQETKTHFSIDDANGNCATWQLTDDFPPPVEYPQVIVDNAVHVGQDYVNGVLCNHFLSARVTVDGRIINADIWTRASAEEWPCQISVLDLEQNVLTNWAFDGFTTTVPPDPRCIAPKQVCEKSYVCHVKPDASSASLVSALGWVCNPKNLNCSAINPGGEFYYPDTVVDHCNWAFNAYYQKNKATQGDNACDFGGVAELVAPSTNTTISVGKALKMFGLKLLDAFVPLDLTCPRQATNATVLSLTK